VEGMNKSLSSFQKMIAGVLLAIAISMLMPTSSIHAASKDLNVPIKNQEKSQWCWVTAPQIIIQYHLGSAPSQCTLVQRGKNIKTCPNEPGTLSETQRAMTKSGISNGGTIVSGTVSFNTIKSNINNYRPMILRKEWKDGKGKKTGIGHLTVVHGFNDDSSTAKVYIVRIRESNSYKDTVLYSELLNNPKFVWTHTIHNIRK